MSPLGVPLLFLLLCCPSQGYYVQENSDKIIKKTVMKSGSERSTEAECEPEVNKEIKVVKQVESRSSPSDSLSSVKKFSKQVSIDQNGDKEVKIRKEIRSFDAEPRRPSFDNEDRSQFETEPRSYQRSFSSRTSRQHYEEPEPEREVRKFSKSVEYGPNGERSVRIHKERRSYEEEDKPRQRSFEPPYGDDFGRDVRPRQQINDANEDDYSPRQQFYGANRRQQFNDGNENEIVKIRKEIRSYNGNRHQQFNNANEDEQNDEPRSYQRSFSSRTSRQHYEEPEPEREVRKFSKSVEYGPNGERSVRIHKERRSYDEEDKPRQRLFEPTYGDDFGRDMRPRHNPYNFDRFSSPQRHQRYY